MPACIHGQLARSCDLCESDQKDAVIMSLEATVARLTAENARLRELLKHAWDCMESRLPRCPLCKDIIAAVDAKEEPPHAE